MKPPSIVKKLPIAPLADIPAMARLFADGVEKGSFGNVTSAMVVCEVQAKDGHKFVRVFGWGRDADGAYALGLLCAGEKLVSETITCSE
jgi:hypothetical protein